MSEYKGDMPIHDPNPWIKEPPTKGIGDLGERPVHTGERIWDPMSADVGFCNYVVDVLSELQWQHPDGLHVVESGIGQGFITRRIFRGLRDDEDSYLGFDMDPYFLEIIPTEEITFNRAIVVGFAVEEAVAMADLLVLDSDMKVRPLELQTWLLYGKPGSHLVIHDTPQMVTPSGLTAIIEGSGISGFYTSNYRGGWHGIHP